MLWIYSLPSSTNYFRPKVDIAIEGCAKTMIYVIYSLDKTLFDLCSLFASRPHAFTWIVFLGVGFKSTSVIAFIGCFLCLIINYTLVYNKLFY